MEVTQPAATLPPRADLGLTSNMGEHGNDGTRRRVLYTPRSRKVNVWSDRRTPITKTPRRLVSGGEMQ